MKYFPKAYDLFDDMFDDFFPKNFFDYSHGGLKTDIIENDDNYQFNIEAPGYQKEDIKINLKNGKLTIKAETKRNDQETDSKGNIIRQEIYTGSMCRSFYVGDTIKPEDISANLDNGILQITVKKTEPETKAIEENNIEIK